MSREAIFHNLEVGLVVVKHLQGNVSGSKTI